jgi:hypothetical protein
LVNRSTERGFVKLSSRISVLSTAAEGDRLDGGRTSPPRIAGYSHSAAIETILARGCSTTSRDRTVVSSTSAPRVRSGSGETRSPAAEL